MWLREQVAGKRLFYYSCKSRYRCLQIQPNKFPGDFRDTFNKVPAGFLHWSSLLSITTRDTCTFQLCTTLWIKLHKKWSNDSFLGLKTLPDLVQWLAYFSWQLNFPGASIKFHEISRICRHRVLAVRPRCTISSQQEQPDNLVHRTTLLHRRKTHLKHLASKNSCVLNQTAITVRKTLDTGYLTPVCLSKSKQKGTTQTTMPCLQRLQLASLQVTN